MSIIYEQEMFPEPQVVEGKGKNQSKKQNEANVKTLKVNYNMSQTLLLPFWIFHRKCSRPVMQ